MQEKLREEHDVYIFFRDVSPDRETAAELKRALERFRLPYHIRQDLTEDSRRVGRIYMDGDPEDSASTVSAKPMASGSTAGSSGDHAVPTESSGSAITIDTSEEEDMPAEQPASGNETGTTGGAAVSMAFAPDDAVGAALQDAEWLVLICTPALKASRRCGPLINEYKKLHGQEHILAVLADGEPAESFPAEIRFTEVIRQNADGTETLVRKEVEPLAAEAREKELRRRKLQLRDAVMRMAAPMFGLNYDDLRQRHREQRIRKLIAALAIAGGCFLLCSITLLLLSLKTASQNRLIESQTAELSALYDETALKYAEAEALLSGELLREGQRLDALSAIRSSSRDLPYVSASASALCRALAAYDTFVFLPEETLPLPDQETWEALRAPCDYDSLPENAPLFPYSAYLSPESLIQIPFSQWDPWKWTGNLRDFDASFLNSYVSGYDIVDCALTAEGVLLIGKDASLYHFLPRESVLEDYGLTLYQTPPSGKVEAAAFQEETASLCLRFQGENRLVRYQFRGREGFETADRAGYEDMAAKTGHLLSAPVDSVLSDDGKFRAELTESGALLLFAEGEETPRNTLYGSFYDAGSLKSIPGTGQYLLELPLSRGALLLDDHMQTLAVISFYYGCDPARGLILQDNVHDWWDAELILLPVRTYEELTSKADLLLAGDPSADQDFY